MCKHCSTVLNAIQTLISNLSLFLKGRSQIPNTPSPAQGEEWAFLLVTV